MMKPQLFQQATSKTLIIPWHKPFVYGEPTVAMAAAFPAVMKPNPAGKSQRKTTQKPLRYRACNIKAVATTPGTEKSTSVKVVVTVQNTVGGFLSNLTLTRALDDINDLLGKTLLLDIVAAELDYSKYIYIILFQY